MTDWTLLAEPQENAEDLIPILEGIALERNPFRRVLDPLEEPLVRTLFNAEVRALDYTPNIPDLTYDPVSEDFLNEVARLIGLWPALQKQVEQILTVFYPVTRPSTKRGGVGSTGGTHFHDTGENFGRVYCTTESEHGVAERLAGSMGNWKLYALGTEPEAWTPTLLVTEPTELVLTRKGFEKPIGVILHELYAVHYMANFNLIVLQSEEPRWLRHSELRFKPLHTRCQIAWETINTNAEFTTEGAAFMQGLQTWTDRLATEGAQWLI